MSFRNPSLLASPCKVKTLWTHDKAQRALQKAVARGKVKKPDRCQRCKRKFPKGKLQGHHRDYRKPLDGIKWYCQACHYKQHSDRFQERAAHFQWKRERGLIGH